MQEDYGGDVQASNAELLALQIKRYKLEKWVREPFFDKTVTGCLVKVAYNGKYLIAEVVDVQERDPGKTRWGPCLPLTQGAITVWECYCSVSKLKCTNSISKSSNSK